MPQTEVWDEPYPYLVSAAASLARDERESCVAALATAESILASLPAEQEIPGRLAAAMLRLAVSRQTGDLPALVATGGRAEALVRVMPGEMLARHPAIRASRLVARGMAELWSGHLDEAVRVLDSAAAAAPAPGIGARASRMPWLSRAGGGFAWRALPRHRAGCPGGSARPGRGAASACQTAEPFGCRRNGLGTPRAQ